MKINKITFLLLVILISCNRNAEIKIYNDIESVVVNSSITDKFQIDKNDIWLEYGWLIDFDWSISDGRDFSIRSSDEYDYLSWMVHKPYIKIFKFELPYEIDLYQVKLRNEHFYFTYQNKEEKDILYPLENTFFSTILKIRDINNHERLTLISLKGQFHSGQNRIGQQINKDYPLVGVWGKLPHLTEYRLVDPTECVYYMEIINKIPGFAVRKGTYLLKKTGAKSFETISSFEDGKLSLEFIDDFTMLITPLFTLSEDEGVVDLLKMTYYPDQPRFEFDDY